MSSFHKAHDLAWIILESNMQKIHKDVDSKYIDLKPILTGTWIQIIYIFILVYLEYERMKCIDPYQILFT